MRTRCNRAACAGSPVLKFGPTKRTSTSAALASTFLLSTRDAETDAFLDKCRRDGRDPAHVARERAGSAAVTDAQRLRGVSRTDAIALHLNHSMVVATSAQVRQLRLEPPTSRLRLARCVGWLAASPPVACDRAARLQLALRVAELGAASRRSEELLPGVAVQVTPR